MKVGIVTEWFERGSAYVSREYAEQLIKRGHDVHIYARAEHVRLSEEPWRGKNVHLGKYSGYPVPKSIKQKDFLSWLTLVRPDVVIFNEQQWIQPIHWVHSFGIPAVAYVDYYTKKNISEFGFYDGLICNTERHKDAMRRFQRSVFIPWGTDLKVFQPENNQKDRTDFFHSFGWSPERKGTDLVIRAMKLLPEGYSLTLHGQTALRTVFPQLENDIDELIQSGRLKLFEETVPAPGLYSKGRVYVYPSRLDGLGLTMAEALSCGLPIVVTDEPPMSEFAIAPFSRKVKVASYTERKDGYFWPLATVDVSELARKMIEVADEARSDWDGVSDSVRRWSLDHLDANQNFEALLPFLLKIVAENQRKPNPMAITFSRIQNIPLSIVGIIWRTFLAIRHVKL